MRQSAQQRLHQAAAQARQAEASGDPWATQAAWDRYQLIADAQRDPGELLIESIKLSKSVPRLQSSS